MMKSHRTFFFLLFFPLSLFSQENGEKTILRIEDDPVSVNEFRTIYFKNNDDSVVTQEDLEQYMELFIDFKLKVKEAEKMGLDTTSKFRREFERYRDQLAEPYFIDSTAMEELLQEAYARTKQEVHASHILVRLPDNPSPEDTSKAWERIMALKEEVKEADGDLMGVGKEAEDEYGNVSASDLGYFSAFRMVYPFEDLAYETEAGEFGGPVRTRFGYHLIKVHDKRPSTGQLKAAHIMKHLPKNASPQKERQVEEQIRGLYKKLQNGAEFESLARKQSDDQRSARRGGRLPWFQAGEMVPEFSKAAFALDSNGQVSEPVKTRYGWHVIKRIDHKGLKDFQEMRPELERELKESDRYQKVERGVIRRLRDEYDLKLKKKRVKQLAASLPDTAFTLQDWKKAHSKLAGRTLLSFADKELPVSRLAGRVAGGKAPEGDEKAKREALDEAMQKLIDEELKAYHKEKLPEENPRYKALVQEYRDGILLFELMERKVWKKALEDSLGLEEFYEENKEDYRWEERLDITYFSCKDEASARRIRKMLQEGKSGRSIGDSIRRSPSLKAKMDSGAYEREDHPFLSEFPWEEGIPGIVEEGERFITLKVHRVLPSRIKELDEARGIVSSDYQDHLEKVWIDKLRDRYEIEVNEELLSELAEGSGR